MFRCLFLQTWWLIMTKRMLWFDKNKQFVKAGYRGQCRKGSDKEGDVFLRGNSVGGVPSGLFIWLQKHHK